MEVRLASGDATATLAPARGGRIAQLEIAGLALLRAEPPEGPAGSVSNAGRPLAWGCYPMVPFAGRVRDGRFRFGGEEHQLPRNLPPHAIHGTLFDRPWQVEHADVTDAVLVAQLGSPWPWAGRVVHRIRLGNDHLSLRLEVYADDEPFPASCGWHPWWRRDLGRGRPLEVELDAAAMWERGADDIPTGDLVRPGPGPWDDCFTELAEAPVLRWPGALALTIESTCLDLVVFDEPDDAICVEPQTGPPDALRLAPVVVEPGLPLVAEATFRWQRIDGDPDRPARSA